MHQFNRNIIFGAISSSVLKNLIPEGAVEIIYSYYGGNSGIQENLIVNEREWEVEPELRVIWTGSAISTRSVDPSSTPWASHRPHGNLYDWPLSWFRTRTHSTNQRVESPLLSCPSRKVLNTPRLRCCNSIYSFLDETFLFLSAYANVGIISKSWTQKI